MASMYETIMDLPLFKGITHEQVSLFLERTHLHFLNYADGERVAGGVEPVNSITYILRGKVRVQYPLLEGDAIMSYTLGVGSVIGADHLFGLHRVLPFDVVAAGACSAVAISKEQYLALLPTDPIYLVNYVNYLSYFAQRAAAIVRDFDGNGVFATIAAWVATLTETQASDISVELPLAMADTLRTEAAFADAESRGVCRLQGATLHISSRADFIESAQAH